MTRHQRRSIPRVTESEQDRYAHKRDFESVRQLRNRRALRQEAEELLAYSVGQRRDEHPERDHLCC